MTDEFTEDETEELGGRHSIRVASRITGLSVDTLRMWERRYGFPCPSRNNAGYRIYSETDVERLVLIVKAMKMGYRASEAIRLDTNTLLGSLANQTKTQQVRVQSPTQAIEPLFDRIVSCDPEGLRRELRRQASTLGTKQFVTTLVADLVAAVGQAWAQGEMSIYQEHLMTEVVSTELSLMSSHLDNPSGPKMLFATLPRERHGLGLRMVALYSQLLGVQGYVLGTDAPVLEIANAASALRIEAVAISVSTSSPPTAVSDQVGGLLQHLPTTTQLWLGGKGAVPLEGLPTRVRRISTWDDLELAVNGLLQGL